MSNKTKLDNTNQEGFTSGENNQNEQQSAYLKAREKELEGRMQPSKVSDWPLVSFVEVNGIAYPVYRKDS